MYRKQLILKSRDQFIRDLFSVRWVVTIWDKNITKTLVIK